MLQKNYSTSARFVSPMLISEAGAIAVGAGICSTCDEPVTPDRNHPGVTHHVVEGSDDLDVVTSKAQVGDNAVFRSVCDFQGLWTDLVRSWAGRIYERRNKLIHSALEGGSAPIAIVRLLGCLKRSRRSPFSIV